MAAADITIGGELIEIPELNFKALKKIYPIVKKMKIYTEAELEDDPDLAMQTVEDSIEIVSIALGRSRKPMTAEEIEEAITQSELMGLQGTIVKLMAANGLQAKPEGERVPAGAEAQ